MLPIIFEWGPDGLTISIENIDDWLQDHKLSLPELRPKKFHGDIDFGGFGNLRGLNDGIYYESGDMAYLFLELKSLKALELKPKTKVIEYELG